MSANVAPSIVRTGLVLDLDAANNKSYVSGSLVWRDLTPSLITGSLVNEPTFNSANGGNIQFDGVDDYVATSNLFNINSATWSVWFNPTTITRVGLLARRLLHKSSAAGNNEINIAHADGNILWFGYSTNFVWNLSAPGISINQWFYASGTYDGSAAYLYLNGVLVNSSSQTGTVGDSTFPLYIGRLCYSSGGIYQGYISNAQIYNRALSATEVLQNYKAMRGRFGL